MYPTPAPAKCIHMLDVYLLVGVSHMLHAGACVCCIQEFLSNLSTVVKPIKTWTTKNTMGFVVHILMGFITVDKLYN
jgi:hypothetical protein